MDGHTGEREERKEKGGGSPSVVLTKKSHEEFSLGATGSPKETLGSYPFKV